jgi:arsenate reductase
MPTAPETKEIKKTTVLFLCTANSCRSIIAEGLLSHYGKENFLTYSAGSMASGFVHPLSIETLKNHHISTAHLRSKSWSEFFYKPVDIVLTVCEAADQSCPIFPGSPIKANWSVKDPMKIANPNDAQTGFEEIYTILETRVKALVDLPLANLDPGQIQKKLVKLGQ